MRRNLTIPGIILVVILFRLPVVHAQQNGNMEAWSESGSPPPFNWLYPTGWTTNNATTEFSTAGTKRSTDAHSGTYAAQLRTVNVFGNLVPAQLVLGAAVLDFPNYSVIVHTGGEPLTTDPHRVSFFYKLESDSSANARASILIKRGNGTPDADTLYHESIELVEVSEYVQNQFILPDLGINPLTDSIVIVFESHADTSGNNFLYIDDVIIDFVSATNEEAMDDAVLIFPNPVKQGQSVQVVFNNLISGNIRLLDNTGRIIKQEYFLIQNDRLSLNTEGLLPGIYFLLADGVVVEKLLVLVKHN